MKQKISLNKDNLKILICCHKDCTLPNNDDGLFLPIHVGASLCKEKFSMQRDDQVNQQTCDNISAKNASFCELTAMYWAWKNIKTLYPKIEYIGLNHYRRYFCFDKNTFFEYLQAEDAKNVANYKIDKNALQNLLQKKGMLVAKQKTLAYAVETDYAVCHVSDDIKTFKNVCHELYPDYDDAVHSAITCGNKFAPCNMFVMPISQFDSYCKWLFDILFECERRIDISCYTKNQSRVFGYLAERFFNAWLYKNAPKCAHLPIYTFDLSFASKKRKFLSRAKFYLRKELTAFLINPRKK